MIDLQKIAYARHLESLERQYRSSAEEEPRRKPYRRLRDEQKIEARRLLTETLSYAVVAEKLGVRVETISAFSRRERKGRVRK